MPNPHIPNSLHANAITDADHDAVMLVHTGLHADKTVTILGLTGDKEYPVRAVDRATRETCWLKWNHLLERI